MYGSYQLFAMISSTITVNLDGFHTRGNILFNDFGTKIEIVDLNRLHFCTNISTEQGLKNFERLNIDRQALCIMAEAYANGRGLDSTYCKEYIIAHRWHKHIKQGITNL